MSHESVYKDSSSLLKLQDSYNRAGACYYKQKRTKKIHWLQQNAKLRKAGMRAHKGDCNVKKTETALNCHRGLIKN